VDKETVPEFWGARNLTEARYEDVSAPGGWGQDGFGGFGLAGTREADELQ
jgi:hypothetical protein